MAASPCIALDFEPESYARLVSIFGCSLRAGSDPEATLPATACIVGALLDRANEP
jgi:hypothetical protein